MDGYRDTLAAAELRPGRRLPLMRAIVDDPQMTARVFSTISGVLPSDDLMTPELRERVGV